MKNVLRPTGIIAFVVIIGLMAVFWLLAANWLLKVAVEEAGSAAVGAKVELDSADLSLSPFGISLINLQVTDPEKPMQNLVQLARVDAHVSAIKLLMGQLIIEDLSAEGVRLNTARASSGELPTDEVAETADEAATDRASVDFSALQKKLPSVDEIIEREPLATLTLADDFKQNLATSREEVGKGIADLPDEDDFKQYQKKLELLTSGKITSIEDLKQRKSALDELKISIRQDKEALSSAKEVINTAKTNLSDQFEMLKDAPSKDLEEIKSKYSFSSENIGNISGLLFGEEAKVWIERIRPWVAQVQKMTEGESQKEPPAPPRGEGRVVHFSSSEELPDVLIRKGKFSIETSAGNITANLYDATHQPEILGKPMRLVAVGEGLTDIGLLRINGIFDHANPKATSDKLSWVVEQWQLNDLRLSGSSKLAVAIAQAQTNMKGELNITNGVLAGAVNSRFSQVTWQSEGEKGGSMGNILKDIDHFMIDADVGGKPLSPRFKLHSDLDEKLKDVFSGKIKARQAELETKLRARLDEKVEQVAAPYRQGLNDVKQLENEIKQRLALADEMLKAEIKGAVESKKDEVKDKLKDKLKGLKF